MSAKLRSSQSRCSGCSGRKWTLDKAVQLWIRRCFSGPSPAITKCTCGKSVKLARGVKHDFESLFGANIAGVKNDEVAFP